MCLWHWDKVMWLSLWKHLTSSYTCCWMRGGRTELRWFYWEQCSPPASTNTTKSTLLVSLNPHSWCSVVLWWGIEIKGPLLFGLEELQRDSFTLDGICYLGVTVVSAAISITASVRRIATWCEAVLLFWLFVCYCYALFSLLLSKVWYSLWSPSNCIVV